MTSSKFFVAIFATLSLFTSSVSFAKGPFKAERACYESLRGYSVSLGLHLKSRGWLFVPERKGGKLGFVVLTANKSFFVRLPYQPNEVGNTDYHLELRLPGEKVTQMVYHHQANWREPGARVSQAERYPISIDFTRADGQVIGQDKARSALHERLGHYVRTVEDAYRLSDTYFSNYMPTSTWDEFSAHLDECAKVQSPRFKRLVAFERVALDRLKPVVPVEARGLASEEETE